MALAIGNLDVHAKLCVGDVRSNEIFYHKNHLSQFHNRYRASQAKKDGDTDQRKKVLPKHMRGDKFQTKYINQMNSSLLQTLLKICRIDGSIQSLIHAT